MSGRHGPPDPALRGVIAGGTAVYKVAFNADGAVVAVGFKDEWKVKYYHVDSSGTALSDASGSEVKISEEVYNFVWHPGVNRKERLMILVTPTAIRVWDTQRQHQVSTISGLSRALQVRKVAISSDAKLLAIHTRKEANDVLHMADMKKEKVVLSQILSSPPRGIAFTADCQQLLVCQDQGITLLDAATLRHDTAFIGHCHQAEAVAVSPDNKWIASGGSDAVASVWDLEEGVCMQSIVTLDRPIKHLCFSGDSQYLAIAAYEQGVQVIEVATGKIVYEHQVPPKPTQKDPNASRIQIRPSGTVAFHPRCLSVAYIDYSTDTAYTRAAFFETVLCLRRIKRT